MADLTSTKTDLFTRFQQRLSAVGGATHQVASFEEADYGRDYSFAQMRSQLHKAKDYAIEHQEELIAQFKANAQAGGTIIYEARTAEDVNRYIYELCKSKGIDLVVKAKIMVSEETELNAYLAERL